MLKTATKVAVVAAWTAAAVAATLSVAAEAQARLVATAQVQCRSSPGSQATPALPLSSSPSPGRSAITAATSYIPRPPQCKVAESDVVDETGQMDPEIAALGGRRTFRSFRAAQKFRKMAIKQSKYSGVSWHKRDRRWQAALRDPKVSLLSLPLHFTRILLTI